MSHDPDDCGKQSDHHGCAQQFDEPQPLTGNYFVSTYPPFSCWNTAALADYRHVLEEPLDHQTPLGLYVHIPFCVDRCHYCYYLSHDDKLEQIDDYLDALIRELGHYAQSPALAGRRPEFVYFGGGTPSLLATPRVERLLEGLQNSLSWDGAREVTFECAPRSVTEAKLRALRRLGVTRINLGAQQMNDEILQANGRVHLVDDIERAYAMIRTVGFDVVNIDLIVGLIDETEQTFFDSLDAVIDLEPDTVTIYQLEIPLNTPLWQSMRDGTLDSDPADWEEKHRRLRDGITRLEAAGYTMCSAYTAARDPKRHEFVYQNEQYRGADLLGIGSSAFSHLGGINQQNQASLGKYLQVTKRGELPLWRAYALTDTERMVREFVLQLKLGLVPLDHFRHKFGTDPRQTFSETLVELQRRGWLEMDDTSIRLTRVGTTCVDRMIPAFYLPEHQGIRYS